MDDFAFYFKLGWEHIISWNALDHQLFILALIASYSLHQIKNILILVTAFTVGHTITLALSTLSIINFPAAVIEFLIPCTIVIAAIANITKLKLQNKLPRYNYIIATFFGLIHGLGFAIALRFMLAKNQSLGWSLLSFNLGLEAGQIVLVILLLLLAHVITYHLKFKRDYWVLLISTLVMIVAIKMAVERLP